MAQQFGTFDSLQNRKDLMRMWNALGKGCCPEVAAVKRAAFLKRMLKQGDSPLASVVAKVKGTDSVGAYGLTVAAAQALGVDLNEAANELDRRLRVGHDD